MYNYNYSADIYSVFITIGGESVQIPVEDIENLYFIEDIFSYSVTGKLQCYDRWGFLEFGHFTGNDGVGIVYGINHDFERAFDILTVRKIRPHSTVDPPGGGSDQRWKASYLELILVDGMYKYLTNFVYSVSWKETRHSLIIKDIAENALGISSFLKFEDTNEKFEIFYIPYWTPKQTIDWIMKRSSGIVSKQPSYLFFNCGGGFSTYSFATNYITLENLLMNDGIGDLMGKLKFESEDLDDSKKVLGYNISGIDNHSKREIKGGYRLGYDFHRRKFLKKESTYAEGIEKFTLLGKRSLFSDISEEIIDVSNYGESDKDIIDNIYYNEWAKRYSIQQTASVITPGDETRYAGGMLEIEWPSADKKEMFNKNMGGKYLIRSITHQFSTGRPYYRQKMILIKNAYEDSDHPNLMDASKKNLGEL